MNSVAVVGLGYVGIPVAARIAESGLTVIGVDIDQKKVDSLNGGEYPLDDDEPGIAELIGEMVVSGRFSATTRIGDANDVDAWLVCVQTPFDVEAFKPNLKALRSAVNSIASELKVGAMVVIESTIPPGTMEGFVSPLLEQGSELRAGVDFGLGHCPERVMPGKLMQNLKSYSRVLGASDERTHIMMLDLYSRITSGELHTVDITTAEVVKTFENTYRDVEIAIANDFAQYCDAIGVDFFRVRDLVNQVEGRNLHLPGGGVGGHCIPKDTWLLAYGAKGRYRPDLLLKAREVNDSMPSYVARRTLEGLADAKMEIGESVVAILGVSYLGDSGDTRNSPSAALHNQLKSKVREVRIHDHIVKEYNQLEFSSDLEAVIDGADALIAMVAHSEYQHIDLNMVCNRMRTPIIIDARDVFNPILVKQHGIAFCAIGRGADWDGSDAGPDTNA